MPLINMSQIRKLNEIFHTYDAAKVQTKMAKPGESTGNYTVEEMFEKVAKDYAALTGGSKLSVKDLDDALNAFKSKKVRDVVRLELSVDASNKVAIPEDLEKQVPGIDKAVLLPVYNSDNSILLDEKGKQLTLDVRTGAFSGTPSIVDAEATAKQTDGTTVYKTAVVTSIKVFPTGEWSLNDLPEKALLDNDEMQLIAYRTALDKIVVELAKDAELIAAIKKQVGTQTVEDALAGKANLTDIFSKSADGKNIPLFRQMSDSIKRVDLDDELKGIASGEEQLQKDHADLKGFCEKTLKKDIEALQASYDAAKVITTTKVQETGDAYNADELFRKIINDVTMLSKLQVNVRVPIKLTVDKDLKITLPDDFAENVPGFDKTKPLRVYLEDGMPLYGEGKDDGLELRLDTGFSATPMAYLKDESRKAQKKFYKHWTGGTCVIYPEAVFELGKIPKEILEYDVPPEKEQVIPPTDESPIDVRKPVAFETSKEYLADTVVTDDSKTYICREYIESAEKKPAEDSRWTEVPAHQTFFGFAPAMSQIALDSITATADKPYVLKFKVESGDDELVRAISVVSKVVESSTTKGTDGKDVTTTTTYWEPAAYGTTYKYRYIDAHTVELKIFANGIYKINYESGIARI